ncbi:MAG: hypothetical protein AB8B87_24450 [Granulosicoccus sp.]
MDDNAPVSIELSTGQRTSLSLQAVQNMLQSEQPFNLANEFSSLTTSDYSVNASYLQIFPLCNNRAANFFDDGCFAAFDSRLQNIGAGVLDGVEVHRRAKLSRNGNRFVTVEYQPLDRDNSFMTIFNAQTGETELRLSLTIDKTFGANRSGAPAVEWGLNDELIYTNAAANPPQILITAPGSADVIRRINLPGQYSGIITDIQLSPDGNKLLIDYERHGYVDGSFPMILDLNTLDLNKPVVSETDVDLLPLADNQDGDNLGIRGWSADSQWIFVTYPHFSSDLLLVPSASSIPHLSAVPVTAEAAILSADPSVATQGVISPLLYRHASGNLRAIWGTDGYNPVGVR